MLLLLVALILYPSSVFLNRGMTNTFFHSNNFIGKTSLGNHEDILVTLRYGFHNEVNQKYRVCTNFHEKKNSIDY